LGFLGQTNLFKVFPRFLERLTSPSLREFVAAYAMAVSVCSGLASVFIHGFPPPRIMRRGLVLAALLPVLLPLWVLIAVVFFTSMIFYTIVVAPIAYLAFLTASIPLESIEHSDEDWVLRIRFPNGEPATTTLKLVIKDHQVQLRTLLVGLPALTISFAASS